MEWRQNNFSLQTLTKIQISWDITDKLILYKFNFLETFPSMVEMLILLKNFCIACLHTFKGSIHSQNLLQGYVMLSNFKIITKMI